MSVKLEIEFVEAKQPITKAVTKFGGQPVWIGTPQWPVSRGTGKPMQFIGQVFIDPALFGACPAKMAYLFMTDDSDAAGMYETWDPDGGENAVILQPGNTGVKIDLIDSGPTPPEVIVSGTAAQYVRWKVKGPFSSPTYPAEGFVRLSLSETQRKAIEGKEIVIKEHK